MEKLDNGKTISNNEAENVEHEEADFDINVAPLIAPQEDTDVVHSHDKETEGTDLEYFQTKRTSTTFQF